MTATEAEKPQYPWQVTYKQPEHHREAAVKSRVKVAVAVSKTGRRVPGRLFAAKEAEMKEEEHPYYILQ